MNVFGHYDPTALNVILGIVALIIYGFVYIGTLEPTGPAEWRSRHRVLLWVGAMLGIFWIATLAAESSSLSEAGLCLLFVVPLALSLYFHHHSIKDAKFCDRCGSLLSESGTTSMRFCPQCGVELITPKPTSSDELFE